MEVVFLLWHVNRTSSHEDDEKLVGVYGTEEEARAAIARVKHQPGFRDTPDAFEIAKYELNKDHWTEGFLTL